MQYVIRDDLDLESQRLLVAQSIQLALSAFPATVEGINHHTCQRYCSQVTAILANVPPDSNWFDAHTDYTFGWQALVDRLASYLFHDGYYSGSLKFDIECLEIKKRVLGREHHDTLRSMNNVATTYYRLGQWTEALKVFQECLEIRKRVLGMEHPNTLQSINGLAATYNSLGRCTEAVTVYEECLEIRKRELGAEHPDTLGSMNNMAATYYRLGQWTEALKVFEECLEIRK